MADNILQEMGIYPEVNIEEDFSEDFNSENKDEESLHDLEEKNEKLNTHQNVKANLCGTITSLEKNYATTTLVTTNDMAIDDLGLIHSGFIFGAADYAAAVAVNEPNVIIIGSRTKFLAPAKVDDLIEFKAKAKFEDSRKREIKVTGYINDIKIYDGIFQAIILEQHIFKIKIKNAIRSYD